MEGVGSKGRELNTSFSQAAQATAWDVPGSSRGSGVLRNRPPLGPYANRMGNRGIIPTAGY